MLLVFQCGVLRAVQVVFVVCTLLASGAFANELIKHVCAHETGMGSRAHENAIDRLSDRYLVFIGDSLSRYQYLALAYYLVTGKCADPSSGEYILSERSFDRNWPRFYKRTSEILTTQNQKFRTTETCFCSRIDLKPGKLVENRSFRYSDIQGRTISLAFIAYFTEEYGSLELALSTAAALRPTDILINYGVWYHSATPACSSWSPEQGPNGACPSMPWLCKQFRSNAVKLDRPYKLWWQTPIPAVADDKLHEYFEGEHFMNPRHVCNLSDVVVIDRRGALDVLEPDRAKQRRFWWTGNSPHVHSEANHAFNHALLARFLPRQAPRTLRNPLWRIISSSSSSRRLQWAQEGASGSGEALL